MNATTRFYSQPSYVGGLPFPVYSGSRRQTGGSVFGAIKRAVVPSLKTAGKEMGKQALGLFTDVAQDVLSGENIGDSIKQRAKERAAEAARLGIQSITRSATQALSRGATKRLASTSRGFTAPPAKRRRRTAPPPPTRRTAPARRAPVRRAPARRTPARRAPVRRAPVRKVAKQFRYKQPRMNFRGLRSRLF